MSLRSTATRPGIRSTATRMGICLATGALTAALAAPATALADDAAAGNPPPRYTGRVTAKSGLLLRDAPNRGSRIVRTEPYGAYVHIFCKSRGDRVHNSDLWYLLTDGTWAWGAASYIANVGAAPRWC
ncbi:SH3 domain-containing protein [Streptomyces monticola]|uniref:SH3 domain-containing protein n=1 Tax=Streptomyces monticola TaxID=2666263 RepID=A0ABW2JHD7_9ACTN